MESTNPAAVRQHMKVVGADRQPVGTVDCVVGDRIKLSKDPQSGGVHHFIGANWVEHVEGDEVRLRQSARYARYQWMDT